MNDSTSPPRESAEDASQAKTNWQYVYLGIRGDFIHEELTDLLGLKPTSQRTKEEGRSERSKLFALWGFQPSSDDQSSIEAQLELLLTVLLPKADLLADIAAKHSVRIQVVGDFSNEGYPGIFFDTNIIKLLGRLGLALDFDLYGWQEPSEITPQ